MKDTDRDPEDEHEAEAPRRRPAWVDEQGDPGMRRDRRPRRDRAPVPGRHDEDGLWEHAVVIGGIISLGTWIAAVTIPHGTPLWQIAFLAAAVTAVTWYTALVLTGSFIMSAYLAAWGTGLTGWMIAARLTSPWHGMLIFCLLLLAAVLIPAGVAVTRKNRDRVQRAASTGRDTANIRECRYWEGLLHRFGVQGVAVRDVIRTEGGYQVHCRLGKFTEGRRSTGIEGIRELAGPIAQHKRLLKGAVYIEEEPAGGSSADFIIHVSTQAGPRLARYLPAENGLLSVNRPFSLGVLDTGREFLLRLREVVVFVVGLRGSGKALALSTLIATPSGWTTMGEIQAGDYVFDEAGRPCRVLAVTEVMHGRPCYEIEFSDGSVITADAQHQWKVDTDASRRSDRARLRLGAPSQDVRAAICALSGPGCSPSGEIVARRLCANHYEAEKRAGRRDQWPLQGRGYNQEHLRKRPEILTTEQMIPGLRMLRRSGVTVDGGVNNYSVRVAAPLQCPEASLLVPPYVLGCWLGDGHSASSRITTADPEILTEIENEGETVWIVPSSVSGAEPYQADGCALAGASCSPSGKVVARRLCSNHYEAEKRAGRLDQWPLRFRDTERRERLAAYTIGGLQARLRGIGVLGNKHIPVSYLRASEVQRRALLAGLLDTDGNCTPSGSAEFSNMNERLARDVYHLVCSLGYKASIRSKTARLYGRDCGTCWTVEFVAAEKVFRLTRKLARQVTSVRSTVVHRYVVAIRPVPSVPVKCIQVDSPGHLYLAGESCVPTHNSTLLNVFLAQLARMPDVLVFMIDLKGGQEARAWLMPWLQGLTDQPVIDWLATTREEADVMLDALKRAGTARAESGRYKRKLRPSPGVPAIIVLCDETTVMTGHFLREDGLSNTKLAVKLLQIAETFRSVAIDPVVSSVRAVVDNTGNSGFKAMSDVRIGMRVATVEEGRQIFPDDLPAARQLAQLKDRGMGIPKVGADIYPPVHFYNITDGEPDDDGHPTEDRITPIAIACGAAGRRSRPEQLVIDAMGEAYAKRWEQPHIARLVQAWREEAGHVPPPAPAPRPDDAGSRELHDEFDELVATSLSDLDPGDDDEPGRKLHPARKRMYQLLIARGPQGWRVDPLWHALQAEGLACARQTVHSWLAQAEGKGYVYRTGKPRSRWIWRLPEGGEYDIPGMD